MNYAQIRKFDIANGPGIRATLFVTGCTHKCPGCFNAKFMNFDYGTQWSPEIEDEFMQMINDEQIKGVTILGGEPLDQIQDDDLLKLLLRIKNETGKNIWIYSGYTYEQIIADAAKKEIISHCDVLVDGLFIKELRSLKLKFKGSSNQRIIDILASTTAGEVKILAGYE